MQRTTGGPAAGRDDGYELCIRNASTSVGEKERVSCRGGCGWGRRFGVKGKTEMEGLGCGIERRLG